MPLYDYHCSECYHQFEVKLPMAENSLPTKNSCPNCFTEGTVSQFLEHAPAMGDSVSLGIVKPDRTFQREIIGRMKKEIPRNHLDKAKFTIPGRA